MGIDTDSNKPRESKTTIGLSALGLAVVAGLMARAMEIQATQEKIRGSEAVCRAFEQGKDPTKAEVPHTGMLHAPQYLSFQGLDDQVEQCSSVGIDVSRTQVARAIKDAFMKERPIRSQRLVVESIRELDSAGDQDIVNK